METKAHMNASNLNCNLKKEVEFIGSRLRLSSFLALMASFFYIVNVKALKHSLVLFQANHEMTP